MSEAPSHVKPEEMAEWKQHPCTKAFLYDLENRVSEAKSEWAGECFQRPDAVETPLANARALGGVQILYRLIDFLQGDE